MNSYGLVLWCGYYKTTVFLKPLVRRRGGGGGVSQCAVSKQGGKKKKKGEKKLKENKVEKIQMANNDRDRLNLSDRH